MRRPRVFSESFKEKVVAELNSGTITWGALQRKYDLDTPTIRRWRDQLSPDPAKNQRTATTIRLEGEIAGLERRIGQLVIENNLLKKVFALAKFHSQKGAPLSPDTVGSYPPGNSASLPEYPEAPTMLGKNGEEWSERERRRKIRSLTGSSRS